MLAAYLFLLICMAADMDKFEDKDIRIFFSGANHVFVGIDTQAERLAARSKYYNLGGFNTMARLVPSGTKYRMEFQGKPMCIAGEKIAPCSTGHDFEVKEKVFGYTLGDGTRCLTLAERAVVKMVECAETEDQIVDFRLASEDQECGADGVSKPNPTPPESPKAIGKSVIVVNMPYKSGMVGIRHPTNTLVKTTGQAVYPAEEGRSRSALAIQHVTEHKGEEVASDGDSDKFELLAKSVGRRKAGDDSNINDDFIRLAAQQTKYRLMQ